MKLRQPLRRVYVRGARLATEHAHEIAEELRVDEVGFDQGPVAHVRLLPNLRVLGPRLGPKVPRSRQRLSAVRRRSSGTAAFVLRAWNSMPTT